MSERSESRAPALATTLTTAADALRGEETARTRVFVQIGWLVAVAVALALPLLPGDRRIALALVSTLALGSLAGAWMYRELRARKPVHMAAAAVAAVVCGQLGILYAGVTSAAPLIVALGLYFFCRTENLRAAIAVYAAAAGAHALEFALVASGVLVDPGFAPVNARVAPLAHFAGHAMLQSMYLMCFLLARLTRKTSLESIDQLQKATRLAALRDVQLAELRQDLDRALKIGGPGRFTGQVLGSWTLGNVLGRGAMGEVYEASQGDAEAAVKLLRRELLSDPDAVQRFLREVRIAASIDSPHVVRVLEASTPEDPIPFLAMERLRGVTLGELVRQGPVTGPRLAALVAQVGGVLDLARQAGIVHRDVKPHNLMACEDGTWKVLDFGVALLGDSTGTLTQGGVVGTPTYMAPEQASGELADHRADVYALGAVIYRCLTGRVPFAARDTPALLYAVVHAMPVRPSAIAATITPHEEAVLAVALAKSRNDRFATTAELAAAFAAASRGALDDAIVRRARQLLRALPWAEPDPVSAEPAATRKTS
jgi:serine/threonine-protein kinase